MFNLTMIKDDEVLMIGGSWDGTRIGFGHDRQMIQMMERNSERNLYVISGVNQTKATLVSPRYEIYRKEIWITGSQKFTMWIIEGMSVVDAFTRLISGYCPALLPDSTKESK